MLGLQPRFQPWSNPVFRAKRNQTSSILAPELQLPFTQLLVQMMVEDNHIHDNEYRRICEAIMQHLAIDDYTARDMVESVLQEDAQSRNINTIAAQFYRMATPQEHRMLVNILQEIAEADDQFLPVEAALLHKVSAFLDVAPSQ